MRIRSFHTFAILLLVMSQLLAVVPPVRGAALPAPPVETTAGTVTDCIDDIDFSAKLAGGGTIDFNCGAAKIELASTKTISANTVIDGGNQITLSGGEVRRLFVVNGGASLTLRNIVIADGFFNGDGGAISASAGSTLETRNVTFRNNSTTQNGSGGAIVTYGASLIVDSRFENNRGSSSGAFYPRHTAVATIENTVFEGNQALGESTAWGGAILIWDGPQVTIRDSRFEGNSADLGGAIYNLANSKLLLERTQFLGNNAASSGGALYNAGELRVSDVLIQGNKAGIFGGGITNAGGDLQGNFVRVLENEVTTQSVDAVGGGILNFSRYTNNVLTAAGVVKLQYSSLAGNVAGVGGAVNSSYDTVLELDATMVSGNRADSNFGGGLYTRGATKLTSSTVSGNVGAGGIYLDDGSLNLQFNTFSGNTNPAIRFPGGTFDGPPPYYLTGNIVDGTCASVIGSQGYNLETGNSCGFTQPFDKQNSDPQLGTLTDNGGPTLTHLPAAGSPAVNAGGANCPATDQRGFQRPADGACDMGSVETAAPPLTVTPFPPPPSGPPPGVTPEPEVTPQPPGAPPAIVRSKVPNGVKPTISVSALAGRAGDTIRISGAAPAGSTQVRVVSMLDGRTMGSVLTNAAANGDYALQFIIPDTVRPGPIELCATVPARDNAEFACSPFTINPPPPASLTGSLPAGVTVGNAHLQLSDAAGTVLYKTPISAAGSYSLADVAPGSYRYSVVGEVSKPIAGGLAHIKPGPQVGLDIAALSSCLLISALNSTGAVSASPSRVGVEAKQGAITNVVGASVASVLGGGGAPVFNGNTRPIGIYVSGVTTNVAFEAMPQANGPVQQVIVEFVNYNGQRVGNPVTLGPPFRTTFNVGQLAPSRGSSHPSIKVTPVVNGREECPYFVDIEVIANPFQRAGVQPNALVWDAAAGIYKIQGIIPHIPGVLPSSFQFPPPPVPALPFLGRYNNRLNAGIQVVGTLNLEGFAHIQAVRTVTDLYVMNRQLLPPSWQVTLLRPNLKLPITNLREASFPFGPYPLVPDYYIDLPFIEVPVISFFGLIDVTVNAGAGIGAGVSISGYVKPLKPEVAATVRPAGRAYAELGVGIRLLAGLAKAGAMARLDAELAIPLTVYLDPAPDFDLDACLTFRFSVRAYVSALWGLAKKDTTKEIAKWTGCVSELSTAALDNRFEEDPSVPDILAAPVIAIGTNGAQVSAFVENTAPAGSSPNSQVMARLRGPGDADWGAPVALSNIDYSADAPVVALVGPQQWPLVAWSEKKLTAAQAAQLGDDLNAILQRQEIVYRLYRDGQWEPAVYLTDDLLGDGLPALAGGTGGAVLAWTRDTDGDWLTRADQRIAATTFDPATRTFAPFALLNGGGLNGDVRVAIDPGNQRPYAVWVVDADANLNTADDRRLALAFLDGLDWVLLNPQPLPPRVDSPSISVGPDGVRLAFLVREPAEDGKVGVVGTNGVLWTARLQADQWSAEPLLDVGGRPIFGEEPNLAGNGNEALLLFRRFGQADDNSRFGQLAVSRMVGAQAPARPLYLTDEPRQNWQASLAINPTNGQAAIVRVSRVALVGASAAELDAQVSIAATQAVAAVDTALLSTADDPVSFLGYNQTADPALDPLGVSTKSPAAGAPFTITATVRNVGRDNTDNVSVRLWAGIPGSGTLLQTGAALPSLAFNATATTTFVVTGSGGEQAFYADLIVPGADGSTANNVATVAVGALTAPVVVDVRESAEWVDGLDVDWLEPKDEVVLGYRIWRSSQPSGPFDLMGENSVPGFSDVPLPRAQTFCYAVESYNATTVSPRSAAVCTKLDSLMLYLPSVRR